MGTQIMAGMIIQPDVRIGQSCIINTGAIVDHECAIQDNSHLATPVTLSGNIVGSKVTHIGQVFQSGKVFQLGMLVLLRRVPLSIKTSQ